MKRILFFIAILFSLNSFSQSTVLLRGDTIKVYKQGGDAVLKVEGHLMLKDYRQGNSNDSVLTWDATTKKVRMMDRNSFAGGSTPTLQQVTTAGNTSTNALLTDNDVGFDVVSSIGGGSVRAEIGKFSDNGFLTLGNTATYTGTIKADNLSGFHNYQLGETGNANDTLATLSDVRAGGGGSGTVTSVSAGFGTNFTTITSTGSVIVDTTSIGVTSWVRTKKVVDSLGTLITPYRFGKSGEDATPAENRTVDFTGTYNFSLNNIPLYQVVIDSSSSSTAYALIFGNKFENNLAIGTRERAAGDPNAAFLRSNWNSGNPYVSIGASTNATANSEVGFRAYIDSAVVTLPNTQVFRIRSLASGAGTKSLRIDPSTGTVTYADTTSGGGGGYTNLTQFVAQNNWKIFHSDGSGDVQELSLGAAGSPFYSVGTSSTPAFFAGVTYATSGTNVKITTQNTTDVGLEIKLASSQTANALNISSSAGTGDLAIIDAAGASRFTSMKIGTASNTYIELQPDGEALFTSDPTAALYDPLGFDNTHEIYGSSNVRLTITSGSSNAYRTSMNGGVGLNAYYGGLDGGFVGQETNQALNFITNDVTRLTISGGGAITVPEQSAPSTPAANTVAIYPKSDGLWYGKDDAGVETMLSNSGSGGLTVGTTTITSGTSTRILYDNAGTLGEYTITGSGTVVAMASDPVFATTVTASQGATTYKLGGSLIVNTTDVGNVGAGEDDLMTYSVPAGLLAANGDYIEFTMSFDLAANANTKQVKVKFGATTIYASGAQAQNDGVITITGQIIRTGAATQRITYSVTSNATLFTDYADYVTAGETLSGAITLKATGEATSNDDIIQKINLVKFLPNN